MVRRLVQPGGTARVDVAPPERAGFTRPAAGEALELDQPANVAVEEGQGGINHHVFDRLNGIALLRGRPAGAKTADRLQRVEYGPFTRSNIPGGALRRVKSNPASSSRFLIAAISSGVWCFCLLCSRKMPACLPSISRHRAAVE